MGNCTYTIPDVKCDEFKYEDLSKSKKTVPWNGHSLVIFTSQKPEGISKDGNNIICTS